MKLIEILNIMSILCCCTVWFDFFLCAMMTEELLIMWTPIQWCALYTFHCKLCNISHSCYNNKALAYKKHFVPKCTFDSTPWYCCEWVRRPSAEAKNPEECKRGAGEMQGIVQTYCIHSFALFGFFTQSQVWDHFLFSRLCWSFLNWPTNSHYDS